MQSKWELTKDEPNLPLVLNANIKKVELDNIQKKIEKSKATSYRPPLSI